MFTHKIWVVLVISFVCGFVSALFLVLLITSSFKSTSVSTATSVTKVYENPTNLSEKMDNEPNKWILFTKLPEANYYGTEFFIHGNQQVLVNFNQHNPLYCDGNVAKVNRSVERSFDIIYMDYKGAICSIRFTLDDGRKGQIILGFIHGTYTPVFALKDIETDIVKLSDLDLYTYVR